MSEQAIAKKLKSLKAFLNNSRVLPVLSLSTIWA